MTVGEAVQALHFPARAVVPDYQHVLLGRIIGFYPFAEGGKLLVVAHVHGAHVGKHGRAERGAVPVGRYQVAAYPGPVRGRVFSRGCRRCPVSAHYRGRVPVRIGPTGMRYDLAAIGIIVIAAARIRGVGRGGIFHAGRLGNDIYIFGGAVLLHLVHVVYDIFGEIVLSVHEHHDSPFLGSPGVPGEGRKGGRNPGRLRLADYIFNRGQAVEVLGGSGRGQEGRSQQQLA